MRRRPRRKRRGRGFKNKKRDETGRGRGRGGRNPVNVKGELDLASRTYFVSRLSSSTDGALGGANHPPSGVRGHTGSPSRRVCHAAPRNLFGKSPNHPVCGVCASRYSGMAVRGTRDRHFDPHRLVVWPSGVVHLESPGHGPEPSMRSSLHFTSCSPSGLGASCSWRLGSERVRALPSPPLSKPAVSGPTRRGCENAAEDRGASGRTVNRYFVQVL